MWMIGVWGAEVDLGSGSGALRWIWQGVRGYCRASQ